MMTYENAATKIAEFLSSEIGYTPKSDIMKDISYQIISIVKENIDEIFSPKSKWDKVPKGFHSESVFAVWDFEDLDTTRAMPSFCDYKGDWWILKEGNDCLPILLYVKDKKPLFIQFPTRP